MIEALLLLRRAAAGSLGAAACFEPVNLADLAREVAEGAMARLAARRPDLSVCAPDELLVRGHPVLLASALRNLVDNALQFTTEGQPVRIAVGSLGDQARVTVEDGGRGIPDRDRARIFDPFFRGAESRAAHDGVGLGLPILREVARAHGGEVSADDSSLGGARFTMLLPLLSPVESAGLGGEG
jgi:signal transduction histidine kinase